VAVVTQRRDGEISDFIAHSMDLARQTGVELDVDDMQALLEASEARGFDRATTESAFADLFLPNDDGFADEHQFEDGDDDFDPMELDWEEDDGAPDYSAMSRDEVNAAMVQRARELNPPDDDPDREYDIHGNTQDFIDYAVRRIENPDEEFFDVEVEPEAEAA
jgi:hypothetical protein